LKQIDWEELYRKNAAPLKGLCRRYTGDETIAEDLVQETFITAIEKFKTFNGIGSPEGWIRKIAINKALLYLREKKMTVPIDSINNQIVQKEEVEKPIENIRYAIERVSYTADELLEVIDHLPLHHRTVFNLYVLDGYSHQQIAKLINISAGTSKSHLARARKKAQELLYQKAIQKEPEPNYRRGMFLFLFLRPNFSDRLFKRGLRNFSIQLNNPKFTFPSETINPVKWTATMAGKTIMIISTVTVVVVAAYLVKPLEEHFFRQKNPAIQLNAAPATESVKSISPDSLVVTSQDIKQQENIKKQQKEKVIVKKRIVIRDTVRLEKPIVK
jgi:RNA polymerase sigma factor (sigma-70 family)